MVTKRGMIGMKIRSFKLINGTMALLCVGITLINHVGITVLGDDKATSTVGDNIFEYVTTDNLFSVYKNGEFVGQMPTTRKMHFNSNKPFLQCNATVIAGKIVQKGIKAQEDDQEFGKTVVKELKAAAGMIGGAAFSGAVASIELPGGAVISATLGGAGEAAAAAAAADAALAAGGATAVITSVIVPILMGAGIAVVLT